MYRDRCRGEGVVTVIHMFLLYQSDALSHQHWEWVRQMVKLVENQKYIQRMLWEISLINIVKRQDLYQMTQFLFFVFN